MTCAFRIYKNNQLCHIVVNNHNGITEILMQTKISVWYMQLPNIEYSKIKQSKNQSMIFPFDNFQLKTLCKFPLVHVDRIISNLSIS